jgi:uncharacterized protein YxjI
MPHLFALHQVLFSFGGDAWIEDGEGNRVFEVDGKAFALARTLDLLDPSGSVLYTLRAPVFSLRQKFEIRRGADVVASIQKAFFTFLGDRFSIELEGGETLQAEGDFLDHEYRVLRGDTEVIAASRSWFSLHDTYGVRVADQFDDALALAIVIAIEQMERQERDAALAGPLN